MAARGKSPYGVLITHGFIMDSYGRKMSKSLGNVIDPKMITDGLKDTMDYPGYGVDCLRSWVFSSDYTIDFSVGPVILGNRPMILLNIVTLQSPYLDKTNEALKKLRNSLRFIIGNLFDFNSTDLITYGELLKVKILD